MNASAPPISPVPSPPQIPKFNRSSWRWLLLLLVLVAFARILWQLDAKTLWWDESLSLQRAEESWMALLAGKLIITDGVNQFVTQDQHPFAFFVVLGLFVRLMGDSEFVLRLPSAFSATLLVPALWSFCRYWVRRGVFPPTSSYWCVGLATINPFFLWYGQEARPYLLWSLLAILSTHWLLRLCEPGQPWAKDTIPFAQRTPPHRTLLFGWLGYVGWLLLFLATHYFSVLLVAVHGAIIARAVGRWRRRWGVVAAVGGMATILLMALGIAWLLLRQPGAGTNFSPISWIILERDLLNAMSLGLSVNIERVWPLDIGFGLLALVGAGWMLRNRRSLASDGWVVPAMVLIPVMALFSINLIQPVYMNARHLALISGPYVMLMATGLGVITYRNRFVSWLLMFILVGGSVYSSFNYFTQPEYGKGPDFAKLDGDLRVRLQPGDLVLVNPPFAWRYFRYYLPLDAVEQVSEAAGVAWRGAPLAGRSWAETNAQLAVWGQQYRRIWLITEGTVPFIDPDRQVEAWLKQHAFQVYKRSYFSPNAYLDMALFLPLEQPPPLAPKPALNVVYNDQIVLRGIDIGRPIHTEGQIPVTLFWDARLDIDRRYKYILQVIEVAPDGQRQEFAPIEQEPYNGFLPTNWWHQDEAIFEYTGIHFPQSILPMATYVLHISIYDWETLEKLPITGANGQQVDESRRTLILPFVPMEPWSESPLW